MLCDLCVLLYSSCYDISDIRVCARHLERHRSSTLNPESNIHGRIKDGFTLKVHCLADFFPCAHEGKMSFANQAKTVSKSFSKEKLDPEWTRRSDPRGSSDTAPLAFDILLDALLETHFCEIRARLHCWIPR